MQPTRVTTYISGGTTRCVQASFRMIVATLTGTDPGESAADQMTGYVEGRGTWQFRMMLALADLSLNVIDHELLDFHSFATDPYNTIQAQTQNDLVTRQIMAETDIDAEVQAVRRCLSSPRIALRYGVPTVDDLCHQIELGRLVICNVNLQVLKDKPDREGHILLVEQINANSVIAHDPGPDGALALEFSRDLFMRSWNSPSAMMANFIAVWK